MTLLLRAVAALLLLAAPALPRPGRNKQVRIVVPFPAGGSSRHPAAAWSARSCRPRGTRPVIIDNRAGAGRQCRRRDRLSRRAGDGYTLLCSPPGPLSINHNLYKTLPYDWSKFVADRRAGAGAQRHHGAHRPAGGFAAGVHRLCQAPIPARRPTPRRATARPRTCRPAMLATLAGIELVHVPYKGEGPALVDITAGRVDIFIGNISAALRFEKPKQAQLPGAGQPHAQPGWRPTCRPRPSSACPTWWPAPGSPWWRRPARRTPSPRRSVPTWPSALKLPEMRARFLELGAEPQGGTPAETASLHQGRGSALARRHQVGQCNAGVTGGSHGRPTRRRTRKSPSRAASGRRSPWPACPTGSTRTRPTTSARWSACSRPRPGTSSAWKRTSPNKGDYRTNHVGIMPVIAVRGADGDDQLLREPLLASRRADRLRRRRQCRQPVPLRLPLLELRPFRQPARHRLRARHQRRGRHAQGFLPRRFQPEEAPHHDARAAWCSPRSRPTRRRSRSISAAEVLGRAEARAQPADPGDGPFRAATAQQLEALCREREGHLSRLDPAHLPHDLPHLAPDPGRRRAGEPRRRQPCELHHRHAPKAPTPTPTRSSRSAPTRTASLRWPIPACSISVEEFGDHIQLQILSVFPGFILQQIHNCLAVRHVVPRGVGKMDLVWTYFGFADDTPEMNRRRLKQQNLVGPAGFISDGGRLHRRLRPARHRGGGRRGLGDRDGRQHHRKPGDPRHRGLGARLLEGAIGGTWVTRRMPAAGEPPACSS